jgi:hypothetical protein
MTVQLFFASFETGLMLDKMEEELYLLYTMREVANKDTEIGPSRNWIEGEYGEIEIQK